MHNYHQPVLLQEALTYLSIQPAGIYVDATFGRGGHARAILDRLNEKGVLLAMDKDPAAVAFGQHSIATKATFLLRHGSFALLQDFVEEMGLAHQVNGILLDLGVSSPQLEDAARGFSFTHDGPLDMRMDPTQPLDAATWINQAPEQDIRRVLHEYGQERFARRIAKAIVQERRIAAITHTTQLAQIIAKAHPAWQRHKHPATRSFQAIRIHINQELAELKTCLEQSFSVLAIGGRLAVISFHSGEDKLVKHFFRQQQRGNDFPRDFPVTQDQCMPKARRIAWGVTASEAEIKHNPRSRSAVLRVAEKLQ